MNKRDYEDARGLRLESRLTAEPKQRVTPEQKGNRRDIMNEQRLEMKYHPAKKEVRFRGIGFEISKKSALRTYMNDRGNFVLQNQGEKFFEAIAGAFDGKKAVQVDVITTRLDYEDFEQMVEDNNKSEKRTIEIMATLLAELPDMDATYREVKKHGERSIGILEKHLKAIRDIPLNDERVKGCVDDFAKNIDTEKSSIHKKMKKMTNDHINLCFAGVYSAGKSTLINAILGYRILPEAMKSTTAKMFRIESPHPGNPVQIDFAIKDGAKNHGVILSWDETSGCFVFGAGPTEENATRMAIQGIIDANKSAERHDQMLKILGELNSRDDIEADIKVYFPVPLDNERVQFVIYDTPGTDSNVVEHQGVLQSALSEQTHSILVFVAAPNRMEGKGNKDLMSYLKAAEKEEKASIDLDRSLFVINFADLLHQPQAREAYREEEITDESDENFSIKLAEKRVFFTVANLAYLARAKILGVQIDEADEDFLEGKRNKIDKEYTQYFRQNWCADSEYATKNMLETSAAALENAKDNGDTLSAVLICSGLYALEEEIKVYGEKYATAVRAFAIIDSVDKALVKVKTTVDVLKNNNSKNLDEVNREIKTLRETITTSIKEVYVKQRPSEERSKYSHDLDLDAEYVNKNIVKPVLKFVDELLEERLFGYLNPEYKEEDKAKIVKNIKETLKKYTGAFSEKRQALLEKLRDAFIADVKSAIQRHGGITDEAKAFILAIDAPEIEPLSCEIEKFGAIYDANKCTETILLVFNVTGIKKADFMKDVKRGLIKILGDMSDGFVGDFIKTLQDVQDNVIEEFAQNMDRYSRLMRAKLTDKEAMAQLGEKIAAAASDLKDCQDDLETAIWGEKK